MSHRLWECKSPRRYTDEMIVDNWIDMHREAWFENPINGFYRMENIFRSIAKYWLEHGEHGPDYDRPEIIKAQTYWDEYMELYKEPIIVDD